MQNLFHFNGKWQKTDSASVAEIARLKNKIFKIKKKHLNDIVLSPMILCENLEQYWSLQKLSKPYAKQGEPQ